MFEKLIFSPFPFPPFRPPSEPASCGMSTEAVRFRLGSEGGTVAGLARRRTVGPIESHVGTLVLGSVVESAGRHRAHPSPDGPPGPGGGVGSRDPPSLARPKALPSARSNLVSA